ncbi:hypothetical protein LguiA_003564 [Lonicera macranthoides]
MAEDAQLVFCPYSYIINPVIRRAMEVDIKGAIVILDEAHNIEDITREAGSVDVEEDVLLQLQTELGQLSHVDETTYLPLLEMMQDIISWINRRKQTLEKHEFQHYFSCWTGDKALRELQEANISQQCFPTLQECATKAIKDASDAEKDAPNLSGMSATMLEGLFSSLSYFFSGNGIHIYDYQLVLRRYIKRDAGNFGGEWTCTMSLWCLNPSVVFKDIATLSLSVILTSGTLSPMNSFSSELGVQFGTCLEAPHVIDVESQLWTAVISSGPDNYPLNASYRTADAYAFQDSLGISLQEICKVVPGGCLVFFPSYKLMEKLCSRWQETGQWSRLNAQKSLFVEPRGGNQDDFDPVLKGYYDSIRHGTKPVIGKKRRGKRLGLNNRTAMECTETSTKGAAFLAVCRGKVSEGIDFSDENARVVIIVGIPFPNTHDIQVAQKKKYNDTYKSSKNLLSGSEWYCQQAYRALNQAAGRCIRHRFDYGAIILMDERFREERNTAHISKWLRRSIRQYENFDKSLDGLKSFFGDVKDWVGKNVNGLQKPDIIAEDTSMDQSKRFAGKKIQKVSKPNCCGQKVVSNGVQATEKKSLWSSLNGIEKYDVSCAQTESEVQASLTNRKDSSSCREYIDLESDFDKDSRFSLAPSMALFPDDPELTIVKETPGMDVTVPVSTPESVSKDEFSSSTIIQASTDFQDELLFHPMSLLNSNTASQFTHQLVTPERNATADTNSLIPEAESSLSVNSHTLKRRRFLGLSSFNHQQTELFHATDCKTAGPVSFMGSLGTSTDVNDKSVFDHENKFMKSNVPQSPTCDTSSVSSGHIMDKSLQIFCSLCRNPLGLPGNNLYVTCSITSLPKIHLASLWKGMMEPGGANTSSVPVVVSDISSVDQRLCNTTVEGTPGQGIWCKEDGCVFNTIFCPFCSNPSYCLGLQVMATDSFNVQLLNKMLFYFDRLEIKNFEAPTDRELPPPGGTCISKPVVLSPIERFSYSPQQNLGGWRTTRSKMRLPKKGVPSTKER